MASARFREALLSVRCDSLLDTRGLHREVSPLAAAFDVDASDANLALGGLALKDHLVGDARGEDSSLSEHPYLYIVKIHLLESHASRPKGLDELGLCLLSAVRVGNDPFVHQQPIECRRVGVNDRLADRRVYLHDLRLNF